ncbi:MAG: metallophosphoesterase family protein [Promethearchaeota archaeon]
MKLEKNNEQLLIGLLSDTHITSKNEILPKRVLDDLKEKKVDYIFHMGDFTSNEVYEFLVNEFGKNKIFAVKGNMDARDMILTKSLPETLELELYGRKIFITHGSGAPHGIIERLNKNHDLSAYDIVIFGHTHHPMKKIYEKDGKLYINPGACESVDGEPTILSSYAYLRISDAQVQVEIINFK